MQLMGRSAAGADSGIDCFQFRTKSSRSLVGTLRAPEPFGLSNRAPLTWACGIRLMTQAQQQLELASRRHLAARPRARLRATRGAACGDLEGGPDPSRDHAHRERGRGRGSRHCLCSAAPLPRVVLSHGICIHLKRAAFWEAKSEIEFCGDVEMIPWFCQ